MRIGNKRERSAAESDRHFVGALLLLYLLVVGLFVFINRDFLFGNGTGKALQIAVVLHKESLIQQSALREGMEQAAYDYNCELSFSAPRADNDFAEQDELIELAFEKKPDALIFNPVDYAVQRERFLPNGRLRPSFIINAACGEEGEVAELRPDYAAMAQALVERMLRDKPALEVVCIYSAQPYDPVSALRRELDAALRARGITAIKQLAVRDLGGDYASLLNQPSLAELRSARFAHVVLDEEALVLLTDPLDPGAFVKESAGLYFWGDSPNSPALLERRLLRAVLLDNQYSLGYIDVKRIAEGLRGGVVDEGPISSYALIDLDNLSEPESQRLLFPLVQ